MSINLRQTETTRQPSEIKNRAWCQGCGHYNVREEINCPKCGSFFIQERKFLNVQRPRIQLEVLTMDNERKEEITESEVNVPEVLTEPLEQSPKSETVKATEVSTDVDQMQKFKDELLQIVSSVSEFTKSQLNDIKRANEDGKFDNIKQGAKNIGDGAVKYAGVAGDYIKDGSISASRWVTDTTRKGLTETQEYIESIQRKAQQNYINEPERYPELTSLCKKLVLFAEAIRWIGYLLIFTGFITGLTMFTADEKPLVVIGRFFIMLLLTLAVVGIHELMYNVFKAIPEFMSMLHRTEVNSRKLLEREAKEQEYEY